MKIKRKYYHRIISSLIIFILFNLTLYKQVRKVTLNWSETKKKIKPRSNKKIKSLMVTYISREISSRNAIRFSSIVKM